MELIESSEYSNNDNETILDRIRDDLEDQRSFYLCLELKKKITQEHGKDFKD